MKILHITPQSEPDVGGIGRFSSHLVRALAARGHQNTIVAAHGPLELPDQSYDNGTPINRVAFFSALEHRDPGRLLRCRLRVAAIKRAFAPDVVHVHLGGPIAFLHTATRHESPAPLVVTVYDLPEDVRTTPTLIETIESAARLAAISDARFDDLRRDVPSVVSRSARVYPVLPRQATMVAGRRAPQPLLLMGGRLVPEKGFAVALEAFAGVHRERSDVRLTLTGDGPMRQTLEAQALALGVHRAVTFTGALDLPDLLAWRSQAWITLVPTLTTESFGLQALEGMYAGTPVIASRLPGLDEVVRDGETGVLVAPGDAGALAAAIRQLLNDDGLRAEMGRAGQARAQERFDWEACVDTYERMYIEART